jgi:hypothetical protein
MRGVFGCLLLLGLVGCDNNPGPDEPGPVSLVGSWTWSMTAANQDMQCAAEGRVILAQNSDTLSGEFQAGTSVQCEGIAPPEQFPTTVTDGVVTGTLVEYVVGPCIFRGTADGDPVERVTGPVACDLGSATDPILLQGTWVMTS